MDEIYLVSSDRIGKKILMKTFGKPSDAITWSKEKLSNHGYIVKTEKWQGIESPDSMWETMNHSFQMFIPETLEELKKEVRPNLPWADDHFEERVSGLPLNPPPSHNWWPFAQKNNEQFGGKTKFSHTYPERIWPKRSTPDGLEINPEGHNLMGVRYTYGDFNDVLNLLEKEPYTRQAFLPIWFPEDTGTVHGERVPCFVAGTKIQTSTGYRNIEDIESGDLVITHTGGLKKVSKTMVSDHSGNIIKVVIGNNNIPIETTEEHPFLIVRNKGFTPGSSKFEWVEEWVESKDIKKGDFVVNAFPTETMIPNYSEKMMRLFGYYLAEGDIMFDTRNGRRNPSKIRFSMSKKDEERGYVDDVVRIIKDELNLDCTISRDNPINPESVRIILSNSKISNLFNELFGTGSYRKIIPHDFLIYPVKHQLELVVGFTRGDGSYESNKKNIELTSVSESIVMSIRIFLWRNNINNSLQKIKIRNPYFNVNLNRTISPKFPTYRIVFSQGGRLASDVFGVTTGENNRKIYKKDWIKNGRVLFRVNNIEVKKNNKQKVYNLEVEEDHTYNLLQCTVHNCTIGYHFMRRGDFLHIVYYIRSCDIIRHFRDDIYMACRKVMWLLNNLKARDYENWRDVKPGYFAMHISSLHCFASERFILNQKNI